MNYKYNIGDKVIYTNSYGVCWGEKTIIGLDTRNNKPTYFLRDSGNPEWFSVREELLSTKCENAGCCVKLSTETIKRTCKFF